MINPLVETCAEVTRAGYENDNSLHVSWYNRNIHPLANFLLNHKRKKKIHPKIVQPERTGKGGRVAIGFSGGIDSYIATLMALKSGADIALVNVNYGQPYHAAEYLVFYDFSMAWQTLCGNSSLKQPALRQGIFYNDLLIAAGEQPNPGRIQFVAEQKVLVPEGATGLDWENYEIPARNLVIGAICAQYGREVWLIANRRSSAGGGVADKSPRFYKEASDLFTQFYGFRIDVRSPVYNLNKSNMMNNHLGLGYSVDALRQTVSCYSPLEGTMSEDHPESIHCGQCYACVKRYWAFQELNIEHAFGTHPVQSPKYQEYMAAEQAKGRSPGVPKAAE